MKKLWQRDWKLCGTIETFETKGDILLDQKLVTADVLGSLAHAMGLKKIGILSSKELTTLRCSFKEILIAHSSGKFLIQPGDEDVHTKIENYLTNACGDVGKKIHTGRSRNDQVLTALRLFTKDQILTIQELLLRLVKILISFSKQHEKELIPGYTHMQQAMPSTIGMWSSAFVEGLLDSMMVLHSAYRMNDQSPLGSAAGYGIPLEIDREYTAQLLGFANVQMNSLYCQNARGKTEGVVLSALIAVLEDINKLATDVLLFTTREFGFFQVHKRLCSGSSIMPQKKNVDIAELLRSKVHSVLGNYMQVISMSSNLMSGYNRDLQDSKKPLIESLEITSDALRAAAILVLGIRVQSDTVQKSLSPEIFATHYALHLVKQGMPFRDAYKLTGKSISSVAYHSTLAIKESTHTGGIGNLCLDQLSKQHKKEVALLIAEKHKVNVVKNYLLEGSWDV